MTRTPDLTNYARDVRLAYLNIFGSSLPDTSYIRQVIKDLYWDGVLVNDAARALRVEVAA